MKRKFLSRLIMSGAMLCLIVLGACALKITSAYLDKSEIDPGEEVTLTTVLGMPDDNYGSEENYHLLYAVCVPEDWTSDDTLLVEVTHGDGTTYNMTSCETYAKLAEFCFPKEGYKWIGFQTEEVTKIDKLDQEGDNVQITLKLRAGNASGDFHLDAIAGCFIQDLDYILGEDGEIDINKAFGHKFGGNDSNGPKDITLANGEKMQAFGLSLYLVCGATFSPEQMMQYQSLHLDKTATVNKSNDEADGQDTYPICATADITNPLTQAEWENLKLDIKVKDVNTGVEEITASDKDDAPVYNLQGVKVKNTTAPGVYIKNGKKFIVK